MISQISLKILAWTIQFSSFLKIIPYQWDCTQHQITYTNSLWRLAAWRLVSLATYSHTIYITARQAYCTTWLSMPQLIFQAFFVLASHLGSMVQLQISMYPEENATFINQLLKLDLELKESIPQIQKSRRRQIKANSPISNYYYYLTGILDKCSSSMALFACQCPGNLSGILFLFLNNPHECQTWFIALVLNRYNYDVEKGDEIGFELKWMVILELIAHLYEWTYVFFFVMPTFTFLCCSHDWVDKLRFRGIELSSVVSKLKTTTKTNIASSSTSTSINTTNTRTHNNSISSSWTLYDSTTHFYKMKRYYSCFQLLTGTYNRLTHITLPVQSLNTLIMTATSLYGSVCFYGKISLEAYLVFPSTLIAIFIYSSILYNFSASLNMISEDFRASWAFFPRISRNKLMYKYLQACGPLRIYIGDYYYIHRYTLVTYVSIILGFTINLLLTY